MKKIVFGLLMLLLSGKSFAQHKIEVVREKVDSVLTERYEKITYDTTFIKRPDKRLMLRMMGSLAGNVIKSKNVTSGNDTHAHLSTETKGTMSVGANYMGLTATLALNPGKLSGRNKDFEINVNAFTNRYSLDFSYQESKTLSGNISTISSNYHVDKGFVSSKMLNIAGYYTFNYKRFSYPAAFAQSYIQKRSVGSWLAGFSYQGGTIKTTDKAPSTIPETRIYVGNFAIGGGYGYNLVIKNVLLHASGMPTFVVLNNNNVKFDGVRKDESTYFPEMIINGRAAVVYSINPKYFVGSTFIVNTTLFGNEKHYTEQVKWRGRVFFGFRL